MSEKLNMINHLDVTSNDEVNGCTTVEQFVRIGNSVLCGIHNILRTQIDLLNEKVLLLHEQRDWMHKATRLAEARTNLTAQVVSLKFEISSLKYENRKQKEHGHHLERKLEDEKKECTFLLVRDDERNPF